MKVVIESRSNQSNVIEIFNIRHLINDLNLVIYAILELHATGIPESLSDIIENNHRKPGINFSTH